MIAEHCRQLLRTHGRGERAMLAVLLALVALTAAKALMLRSLA